MKKVISDGYELRDEFVAYDRDYYSIDAYDAMLQFYDDVDPDATLDVIGMCGEFTEYDDADELESAYEYLYSLDDWKDDNDIPARVNSDEDDDGWMKKEYLEALIEKISENLYVFTLDNGHYLVSEA